MNLGDGFHHETGVIVVDKISYSIHGVKPRTVRVLILQDEIQISFCDFPVVFDCKELGGARQQEGAISGSVNNSAFIERSVGTTAGRFRRSEILDISGGVSRNRFEDQLSTRPRASAVRKPGGKAS